MRIEQEEGPQIQIDVVTDSRIDRIRVKNVGNQPAKDVAIQQPEQEQFTADFFPSPIPFVNNGDSVEVNAIFGEQTTPTQRVSRLLGDILTSHHPTQYFSVRFANLKGTYFRQRFRVHRAIFQEEIHCYLEGPRVVESAKLDDSFKKSKMSDSK